MNSKEQGLNHGFHHLLCEQNKKIGM